MKKAILGHKSSVFLINRSIFALKLERLIILLKILNILLIRKLDLIFKNYGNIHQRIKSTL